MSYSVGFTLPDDTAQIYDTIPETAWAPAYNADGQPRQGADVAEITDLVDLTAWPKGMWVNRAPRAAPPGSPAALRGRGRLPTDRLRHQHKSGPARRPRGPPPATSPLPGDRIRCAKDTGLDRFPLQGFAQNRIWCLIVALACDLLAFSQLLALTSTTARAWEPRTIRLRLISILAVIVRHARRTVLRYKTGQPWSNLLLDGLRHLHALTGFLDTRLLHLVHHNPEGRTLAPGKARPPRGDTRQAVTPTCHNPTHNTGNDATKPHPTSQ